MFHGRDHDDGVFDEQDHHRCGGAAGGGGFHSVMRLYPGDWVGTVVMTNATGFDARTLLDTIDPALRQ